MNHSSTSAAMDVSQPLPLSRNPFGRLQLQQPDFSHASEIIERIGATRQKQAGYDRPVFIYHIVAKDTVDEIIMLRRESKREVQDLLLEAMKRRM